MSVHELFLIGILVTGGIERGLLGTFFTVSTCLKEWPLSTRREEKASVFYFQVLTNKNQQMYVCIYLMSLDGYSSDLSYL